MICEEGIIAVPKILKEHSNNSCKPLEPHFQPIMVVGVWAWNGIEKGIRFFCICASANTVYMTDLLEIDFVQGAINGCSLALTTTSYYPAYQHAIRLFIRFQRIENRVRRLRQPHHWNQH